MSVSNRLVVDIVVIIFGASIIDGIVIFRIGERLCDGGKCDLIVGVVWCGVLFIKYNVWLLLWWWIVTFPGLMCTI